MNGLEIFKWFGDLLIKMTAAPHGSNKPREQGGGVTNSSISLVGRGRNILQINSLRIGCCELTVAGTLGTITVLALLAAVGVTYASGRIATSHPISQLPTLFPTQTAVPPRTPVPATPPVECVTVIVGVLKIRDGAGTNFHWIDSLEQGDIVHITGRSNGWIYVIPLPEMEEATGWVKEEFTRRIECPS